MAEESSFFNTPDGNFTGVSADNDYRHFRLIYESEHGFCRLFTARRHGRTYVIKTLREPYLDAPLAHAALRKEFECGIMVDSLYVARTYDFITLPKLGNAIVMEYCPGMTLAQLIADGAPLSSADIGKIIFSLARGIDDIHCAGLIHRDLKPDNVIWMPQSGSLKIIDLGFSDSESFYMLHDAAGTLRYTPAEKSIATEDATISPDTYNDLFALGVLLTDLVPISPRWQQKVLQRLSSMLRARSVSSGSELETRYRTLSERSVSKRRILIIFGTALLLLTGTTLIHYAAKDKTGRQQGDRTIEKPAMHIAKEMDADTTTTVTLVKDEPEISSDVKQIAKNTLPETDNSASSADMPQLISAPPDELIKDEYGVCMAEAKYTAYFRRDEIDEYTVTATDRFFTESISTLQSDTASPQSRHEAYGLLTTDSIMQRRVAMLTLRRFPSANRQRILGLSRLRRQYLVSDMDLTHLQP